MIRVARLIRKLENFAPLPEEEKRALIDASSTIRRYGAHEDLIQEGALTDGVKIILDGFACRYKVLPDGRRQIVAYFVPGDMCDLRVFLLKRMDHSIGTLCSGRGRTAPAGECAGAHRAVSALTRALWWVNSGRGGNHPRVDRKRRTPYGLRTDGPSLLRNLPAPAGGLD